MSSQLQHLAPWINASERRTPASTFLERGFRLYFRVCLLLSDAAMIALAFILAYWIRFHLHISLSPEVAASPVYYTKLALILLPAWIPLFALFGLYQWDNLLGGTTEYARTFHACTTGMMLVVLAAFAEPSFVVARGWLVGSWILSALLVCGARFGLRRAVYHLRARGRFLNRAIIVGANGEAASLAEQLEANPAAGFRILGLVNCHETDSGNGGGQGAVGLPRLGSIEEIRSIVTALDVQEIIVATSSLERSQLFQLYEKIQPLKDVHIRLSTGLYEVLTTGVHVTTAASIPLICLDRLRLTPLQSLVKGALEYSIAAIGLVVLAPLLLFIAVMVKMTSEGPVIYRRRVLGVGGREFDAFKFRTMYLNGDALLQRERGLKAKLQADGKLKTDPRVTPVGAWLRRYSLDELPQLINVLLGQMSLVGPRMITAEEAEKYGRHRANLLTVKPGITGLWQVSGRSDLSYEDRVRLDMHYIRNYSAWLDLQILFVQTPVAVLSGKGAY